MTTDAGWLLPPLRDGATANAIVMETREAMRGLAALQIVDPGAHVSRAVIGGVDCVVAGVPGAQATLLYMHGGGFRLGEATTWTGLASRLAVAAGLRVVVPDYRLAPEHPFPAALHDIAAVYRALAGEHGGPPLLGGDSAGGGLACSLALAARDAGVPSPGVILLSPWLDLSVTAESYASCAHSDQMFSRAAATEAAAQYLAGQDALTPLASPLHAPSLADFPPVWITVAGGEVLRDDTLAFANRLAREGGTVTLSVRPALPHVWPVMLPAAPETADSIAEIATFTASLLARRHSPEGL